MTRTEALLLQKIYITDSIDDMTISEESLRNLLLSNSVESIYELIKCNADRLQCVATINIPQFSNIDLLPRVIDVVKNSKEISCFADIGGFLTDSHAKVEAKRKFGDNHYKLAVQLGLANNTTQHFSLTQVGEMYSNESVSTKTQIMQKLILRVPVIQQLLMNAEETPVNLMEYLAKYLSPSTVIRRRSNIKVLLLELYSICGNELQHIINNINWG